MALSACVMRASTATSRTTARRGALGALVLALSGVTTLAEWSPVAALAATQNQPGAPAASASASTPTVTQNKEQSKNGAKTPENVKPLPPEDGAAVLGKKVIGSNGEDLGLIVNVLVDPDGRPRAAVIDFGGFLGVGSRKIAIDWKALDFTSLGRAGTIELGLGRAQIAAAPEYQPGPPGAHVITAPPAPPPPVDTHK
jgi:hypothetical protein